MDNGLLNGVLFLDFKKAFDSVNHNILLSKLELYGIRGTSLKWFRSYFSNRKQIYSINGKQSDVNEHKVWSSTGIQPWAVFVSLIY
jgi:hypothetical protein